MEIVVEYVLLENLLINLIILKTTALLTKEKGRLFILSAFLGACVTVVLPILHLNTWGGFLVQAGLTIFYLCISFKFKTIKKFSRLYLSYFVTTFLYGGVCFYFESLFGIKSMLLLLGVVVGFYFVVKFLFLRFSRKTHIENFCFEVEIVESGQKTQWKAFLDSGNLLFDPLTEKPVSLINYRVFSTIFKDIELEDILKRSEKLKRLRFAHYISFNTLNCNDKILVFQVDKLCIDGKKFLEKPTLGLSLKNFNEAFGSDIILHNNLNAV